MNVHSIGLNAGIVWRKLNGENRKFEFNELQNETGLSRRDLNAAIGWLAREGKINIEESENPEEGTEFFYITLNYYIG